jgi:hypothetical protein
MLFDGFLPLREFSYFEHAFKLPVPPKKTEDASTPKMLICGNGGWRQHPIGLIAVHSSAAASN